jgi:hypothetical protein
MASLEAYQMAFSRAIMVILLSVLVSFQIIVVIRITVVVGIARSFVVASIPTSKAFTIILESLVT